MCVLERDVHSGELIHALHLEEDVIPAKWLRMGPVNSSIVTFMMHIHLKLVQTSVNIDLLI